MYHYVDINCFYSFDLIFFQFYCFCFFNVQARGSYEKWYLCKKEHMAISLSLSPFILAPVMQIKKVKSTVICLQVLGGLSFTELSELLKLVSVEPLGSVDSQLLPLLSKPLHWYQGLIRVLQSKYQERHR